MQTFETVQLFPNSPFVWSVFRRRRRSSVGLETLFSGIGDNCRSEQQQSPHRRLEAQHLDHSQQACPPRLPACPGWWHLAALLLKGLPLPLEDLEIVADSVCLSCLGFLLWFRTAELFLGCPFKKEFGASEISVTNTFYGQLWMVNKKKAFLWALCI